VLVLIGWLFEIDLLKISLPAGAAMRGNRAPFASLSPDCRCGPTLRSLENKLVIRCQDLHGSYEAFFFVHVPIVSRVHGHPLSKEKYFGRAILQTFIIRLMRIQGVWTDFADLEVKCQQ